MEITELLNQFVTSRDNQGKIVAAFGYGSGLFKQKGYKFQENAMIDTIFVVNNPTLWHQENIKNNPSDYSRIGKIILKYFDVNAIKKSTGVTYQSNIKFMDHTFKYGIIGQKEFIDSMWGNWDTLFIQGRFHKPIHSIRSTKEIDEAIKENRDLAIFVALLTLKHEHPTLIDLYHQICSLSYKGDIRMKFAENPNKVNNIVEGSFSHLLDIYGIKNKYFYTKPNGEIIINKELIYNSLSLLPNTLYEYLQKKECPFNDPRLIATLLDEKITKINRHDSIIQPLTGVLTVGPIKSLTYLKEKIKKRQ